MKGEFEFIEGIRRMFPSPEGVKGIGDDCAVIPQKDGFETLVSTDMLVEGSHFLMDDITPYQLGWKSAASNFSDIAAMGGTPVGSFLAVGLPRAIPEGWEEEFLRGFGEISRMYGFPLLGGDTTSSPDRVCICITVLGKAPEGRSVKRNGAKRGDLVCVTGCLGDSAAGLDAILCGMPRTDEVPYLIDRHYLPRPRVKEGQMLLGCTGVHSMMDISDGIGSDLRHIIEESKVGVEIDVDKIPVSFNLQSYCSNHGKDILQFAAEGGEDYELLFTADPLIEASLPVEHFVIGRVTDSGKLEWKGSDRDFMGFRHF